MQATLLRALFCGLIAPCVFTSCLDPLSAAYVLTNPPPAEKNLNLLTAGVTRTRIHKEFGPPAATYTDRDTGALHDVFRFQQGYSRGARWGMLAGNLAGMSTTGVGIVPQGTSMAVNVKYDDQERVMEYRPVQ